jgi:beta-phosphoglucomutase-like phosphatase (HAD superfamily)
MQQDAAKRNPGLPTQRVQAVLFDLDGTLIDSEGLTDSTIREVVARYGPANAALPPYETRGRTWDDIARSLLQRYGLGTPTNVLSAELLAHWSARFSEVEPLPAAIAALAEVAGRGKSTAVGVEAMV